MRGNIPQVHSIYGDLVSALSKIQLGPNDVVEAHGTAA